MSVSLVENEILTNGRLRNSQFPGGESIFGLSMNVIMLARNLLIKLARAGHWPENRSRQRH
jgi:hypothetical protein